MRYMQMYTWSALSIILSCTTAPTMAAERQKLSVDPRSVVAIPAAMDLAKLKVIYEDGELIKWIDEKGRTNISFEPAKYTPKPVKQDEYRFCQVDGISNAVYNLPDATSKVVDVVKNDSLIKIIEEEKYFIKVLTPRNIDGWIYRSAATDFALRKYDNYGRTCSWKGDKLVVSDKNGVIINSQPLEKLERKKISGPAEFKNVYGEQLYSALVDECEKVGANYSNVRSVEYIRGTGSVSGPGYAYGDQYDCADANGVRVILLNFSTISGLGDVKIHLIGNSVSFSGEPKKAYFIEKGGYLYTFFEWSMPSDYFDSYAGSYTFRCLYKNNKKIYEEKNGSVFLETNHLLIRVYEDYKTNGKDMSRRYYFDPLTRKVVYSVKYPSREMGMELEIVSNIVFQRENVFSIKKRTRYPVFDLSTGKEIRK